MISLLTSCESNTKELYVYNFASKNPWDDYSYAAHGLLVEEPIQHPYKFMQCYVEWMIDQSRASGGDLWFDEHAARYYADTNSCYIRAEGTYKCQERECVTFDWCDIKLVSVPFTK